MIKIRFLDNNKFLVRFNGNQEDIFKYLAIISNNVYYAMPNFDEDGGWIFHYNKFNDIINAFDNKVHYENEYFPPKYNDIGKNMKLQPYDYQKEAIYYAIENKDALLVLPCGAGKTPIAIGIYLEARERGIISGQGLIVVKASLKKQWQKEVSKFSDFTSNILQTYSDCCSNILNKIKTRKRKIEKLEITDPKRATLVSEIKALEKEADEKFNSQFKDADLLIANYETLLDEKVLNALILKNLQCVMCDEIHYAKTHTTDRSKALYNFNNATIKIGATATPITKDPRDVYGIYKFINPDIFGKVGNFQKRYINFAGYGKINGFKNMDELREKISDYIFIKTKKEVASQLPKLKVIPLYCELSSSGAAKTAEMLEELDILNKQDFEIRRKCKSEAEAMLNEELQKIGAKILALQTFCQELADSPLLLTTSDSDMSKQYAEGINLKENPKMDLCIEKVQEIIDSGEKVIIFSRYERMQQILTDALRKNIDKNLKIAYVSGSLSAEQRYEEAYTKFKEDPEYKVLLCSDAGAEGLNMGHCKYLIEYDLAISYAIQTQRHGRLERADSVHSNVIVYQLIANNSWDEIQQKIVDKKEGFDEDIIKSLARK